MLAHPDSCGATIVRRPKIKLGTKTPNRRRQMTLESLESRIVLSYTFSYTAPVATAVGTAAVDSLVLEPVGGFLLYSVNGSAFSGNWGGTSVPASPTVTVDITLSSGDGSSLTLGTPAGPASDLLASFSVVAPANTMDSVLIDDSGGTTLSAATYTIDTVSGVITGPGINYNQSTSAPFAGGVTLSGSGASGNIYNVVSVLGSQPTTLQTAAATTSTVNVGGGGTLTVNSPLAIYSPPSPPVTDDPGDPAAISGTTINVNDQNDTTDPAATLDNASGSDNAPYEVTGLSAAPVEYGAGVTAVNIDGGTSAGGTAGVIYNVNNTQAGTATTINDGTGNDTANVTGVGIAAGTTLFLNGGPGYNTLNYFAGGLTPSQSTVEGAVVITLPGFGSVDATNYKNVRITGVLSSSTWTSVGPGPIVVTTAQSPGETGDPDSGDGDPGGSFGGLGPAPVAFPNPATGRIVGIAASPTDPNTIYVAAAGGGVWRTTDGGTNWVPLTDNQATLSMGSIAIAPSNSNIIYAGTGEANGALDSFPGDGILKSTNAGASWTLLGQFDSMGNPLFERRSIPKIVVDPSNANIVYAAVADIANGALPGNTGIWKSMDGGMIWMNMTDSPNGDIAPGDSFVDLVMDPTNDQVLYAAASDLGHNAYNGVYKTMDGGMHWFAAGDLPIGGTNGRIALAISPTNNQVLYAAVANTSTGLPTIYQTTNAGTNWTALALSPDLNVISGGKSQAFYDLLIAVDPTDATGNTFYAAGAANADSVIRVVVTPGNPPMTAVQDISGGANEPHADHHALAFTSTDATHPTPLLLDGDDGGIWKLDSSTPSVKWSDLNGNLEITEFVGIAVDPKKANVAYGGSQDNGTEKYTGSTTWASIADGDGGFTLVDQSNNMIVYQEHFGFDLARSTNGGASFATNITPTVPAGTNSEFYGPYVMDPTNSKRLLYGTAILYETKDATATPVVWKAIATPGTGGFDTGGAAIAAIAIAKSSPNTIYVTTGSQIFMTTNDGVSWTDVSIASADGLDDLQVDPFNTQIAYAMNGQYDPEGKIFMTTNGGTKWTDISSNLPDEPARTLAIDPRTTPETLYLGNSIGVYVSYDLGGSWVRFAAGLPNVQVKELDLQLNNGVDVLGAGTYGRGFFEIQANTPLVVTPVTPVGLVEGRQSDNIETATFTDVNAPANTDPAAYYSATIFWGDGSSSAGTIVRDAGGVFHVTGSHTYAEEGMEMITTEITSGGGSSGGATATTTVLDAPLYGSAGNEITGIEGKSTGTFLLGTFTDANPFAAVADYNTPPGAVVVNWGDGTADSTLAGGTVTLVPVGMPAGVLWTITAAHTYLEEGTYSYTVTVTDEGGAETAVDGSAIIADAALSIAGLMQPVVAQDEPAIFPLPVFSPPLINAAPVAVFTDLNPLPPTGSSSAADFTAEIDWGDGTPKTFGTVLPYPGATTAMYEVIGSHTYADAGVNGGVGMYNIQVFVTDDGGSKLIIDNVAKVADNPINLVGMLNPKRDSGLSTGTLNTTNVNQPDFLGTSEPFSTVALFAGLLPGGIPFQIGKVQAGSDGSWNIKSQKVLADGHYVIFAEAVDQFGKTMAGPVPITPDLLIDTTGPKIDGLYFNRLNGQVDFMIKDPVNPDGSAPAGVWKSTLLDSSNYLLTKVHANKAYPGKWIVTKVVATPVMPYTYDVAVTFNGGAIIPGGFYLFTIRDSSNGNSSVQDLAENHLDGVFYGSFPSGNGINGSDFVAELQAYHNKVFAPQTIIGTAFQGNAGVGGPPIAPVHSGIWVPAVPVGGPPMFSTPTSPSNGADPPAATGHTTKKPKGQVVKPKHTDPLISLITSLSKKGTLVVSNNHPKGPKHT